MAYYSSFDARDIPPGSVSITKSGGGTISNSPTTVNGTNGYNTPTTFFNYVLTSRWFGFDLGKTLHLKALCTLTFHEQMMLTLRAAASLAGWSDPDDVDVIFNPGTRRVHVSYSGGITAITFSNDAVRRLFGFASDFSGSATTVTGTQLPMYIVEPTINGASSASVVGERDASCNLAYSANGRSFSIGRTVTPMYRNWVQQYETRAKSFRRFNAGAPAEFTYQDLFETCRTRLPFAVLDGFNDAIYSAYGFEDQEDSFAPEPAVPGSADQFHIDFKTLALARITGLTFNGDFLVFDGEGG